MAKTWGGAGTRLQEVGKLLEEKSIEVHILSFEPNFHVSKGGDEIYVHNFSFSRPYYRAINLLHSSIFEKEVKQIIRKFKLDLLFVQNPGWARAGLPKKINEVPVITRKAASSLMRYSALKRLESSSYSPEIVLDKLSTAIYASQRERAMVRYSDAVVTSCVKVKRHFASYLNSPRDDNKIKVISGGVNTSHFSPFPRVNGRQRNKRKFTILYVGSLTPLKGIPYLIKAISQLKEQIQEKKVLCYLVGERKNYPIDRIVKESNLSQNIKLVGRLPYNKMPKMYSVADVLIHPSLYEGTPLVIMEAMAMKLPVVATAVGGTPTFVKNRETGILVPPFSVKSIVEGVLAIKTDPLLRQRIIEKGRKLMVENYNWQRKTEKLMGIFFDLKKKWKKYNDEYKD